MSYYRNPKRNEAKLEVTAQEISIANLLDLCCQGNRKAQCAVYEKYYRMVFQSCYRIMGNKVEAEDIMQESFIDAFEKISQLEEKEKFGGWLKRIAINKSLNELKSKTRYTVDIEGKEISAEEEEEVDKELMELECNRLLKCIEELPPGFKTITQLFLLEGYDHNEIGEVLGIKSSTSRSQFTRAKVKIKELYKSKYGK